MKSVQISFCLNLQGLRRLLLCLSVCAASVGLTRICFVHWIFWIHHYHFRNLRNASSLARRGGEWIFWVVLCSILLCRLYAIMLARKRVPWAERESLCGFVTNIFFFFAQPFLVVVNDGIVCAICCHSMHFDNVKCIWSPVRPWRNLLPAEVWKGWWKLSWVPRWPHSDCPPCS